MTSFERMSSLIFFITLLYLWLSHVNLALERVNARINQGGHNIPEEVIIRRYYRGIQNLTKKFIFVCDLWIIINNSKRPYTFIAEGKAGLELNIHDSLAWQQIKNNENEKLRH